MQRLVALAIAACIPGYQASAQNTGQSGVESNARIEALRPFIVEAARRFPVPEAWIRAVLAAESGGRTELDGKPITSSAGAMGPMQVMPETYEEMRQRYTLGSDPYDPENNILAGTAYLGELFRRFGRDGMFAAYNAGPDRYQQFLDSGRPLPAETVAYLATLGTAPLVSGNLPSPAGGGGLFFPLQGTPGPSARHPLSKTDPLFAPLAQP